MNKQKKLKIVLSAGGTGGPLFPLIAVAEQLQEQAQFLLIGSGQEFEKQAALKITAQYKQILAGKWRRYFSMENLLAPFQTLIGFFQALIILLKFQPDLVFSAGGFVSVPTGIAAFCLNKKILIHQQDVTPGLANKILAPFANKITVTFQQTVKSFSSGSGLSNFQVDKIIWTGNPVRKEILNLNYKLPESLIEKKKSVEKFGLTEQIPIILVFGGATGAEGINQILITALPDLVKFAGVIHAYGYGKAINFQHPRYFSRPLIDDMASAYNGSDLVIARAGLATLAELSSLAKPSIIIPMPDSHQEKNAEILRVTDSALVLEEKFTDGQDLITAIKKIIYDSEFAKELGQNINKIMPHDADKKIAEIIIKLCQSN